MQTLNTELSWNCPELEWVHLLLCRGQSGSAAGPSVGRRRNPAADAQLSSACVYRKLLGRLCSERSGGVESYRGERTQAGLPINCVQIDTRIFRQSGS